MAKNGWTRVDRVMRSLHLYLGLFLLPWSLVYAASAFCLNHNAWFRDRLGVTPPSWEVVRQVDFVPDAAFPNSPDDQARAILRQLDLEGPHVVQGEPTDQQMAIIRICGTGNYRIRWRRAESRILVEKQQPFSAYRLLHYLHFRFGYEQPYAATVTWAAVVDAFAVSMGLWAVSGVYLWVRRPHRHWPGTVCLAAGFALFVGLVVLLCR